MPWAVLGAEKKGWCVVGWQNLFDFFKNHVEMVYKSFDFRFAISVL